MPELFTSRLRATVEPIWRAQHEHPFITGIGDGSLDLARFRHWVRQDYRFLIEYARTLATASARAPDLDSMTKLAELTYETLTTEMSLHRSYAKQFNISKEELATEVMSPTCQAYTDFLVRVATTDSFPQIVGALLPCMWGFSEIGLRLLARGLPSDPRYAAWVEMYSSSEFVALADWCRNLLERCAKGLPEGELARIEEVFVNSSKYEYLFWDMAWNEERWPIR